LRHMLIKTAKLREKTHRANIPVDFSFMPIPYLKWIGLSLWAHQS